jgi:hypothetical protein
VWSVVKEQDDVAQLITASSRDAQQTQLKLVGFVDVYQG